MRLLERRLIGRRTPAAGQQNDATSAAPQSRRRASCKDSGQLPASKSGDEMRPRRDEQTQAEAAEMKTMRKLSGINTNRRLGRHLSSALNSLGAIKLKTFIFSLVACNLLLAEAGFFTFYFPNLFKPKGFGELSDMIHSLDGQIHEIKDAFADLRYFWGQLQEFDLVQPELSYHEESACSEVFPLFRDQAIEYIFIDYDFYIQPFELYRKNLIEFRDRWYPAGLESKAALPREWEQQLMEKELELKIEWLDKLANGEEFRMRRQKMLDIWTNVRRGLDTSVPCVYLRYAYRQISEDINQHALDSNLESMREAMKVLQSAYQRIEKYKGKDAKIIDEIMEELKKVERFTIKE